MTSAAQDCRLPGPSLVTARQRRVAVLAALLHPGQLREQLLAGAVPVADQEAGRTGPR